MILYFSVKTQKAAKLKVTKQSLEDCMPLVSKICNASTPSWKSVLSPQLCIQL